MSKDILLLWIILFLSVNSVRSQTKNPDSIDVYLVKESWHTGIMFEINDYTIEALPVLSLIKDYLYIDIGWGDADFYQTPGMDLYLAAKAVLVPTPTVIRIDGYKFPIEKIIEWREFAIKFRFSQEEFSKLTKFINDHITIFYNNEETRELTIDFFANLTQSREIAAIILETAIQYDITPALAFSLAYEESRFNPRAVNQNSDSIDRGLFQLNSKAFEKLTIDQFYNPKLNTEYAMKHLRYCIDTSNNEFTALAMYNAGPSRVKKGGTPEKTLNYIYRINSHMLNIQSLFEAQIVAKHQQELVMISKKSELR